MYEQDGADGLKGSFEIYKAEADTLYRQGEYKKAIDGYTTVRFCCCFLLLFFVLSHGRYSYSREIKN